MWDQRIRLFGEGVNAIRGVGWEKGWQAVPIGGRARSQMCDSAILRTSARMQARFSLPIYARRRNADSATVGQTL
jgi:hypothetical protein